MHACSIWYVTVRIRTCSDVHHLESDVIVGIRALFGIWCDHAYLKFDVIVLIAAWYTNIRSYIDRLNSQPHIVHFKTEDDEDCLLQQYFICIEQQLMMESSNIVSAIFLCLAAHYIFNTVPFQVKGCVGIYPRYRFPLRGPRSVMQPVLHTSVVYAQWTSGQ